jgi:hypothetical protein
MVQTERLNVAAVTEWAAQTGSDYEDTNGQPEILWLQPDDYR